MGIFILKNSLYSLSFYNILPYCLFLKKYFIYKEVFMSYRIASGVTSSNLTLTSEFVEIENGGILLQTSAAASEIQVYSGGKAVSTTIASSGHINIFAGGVAEYCSAGKNGYIPVLSGGTAKNCSISEEGGMVVSSGGQAFDTTVIGDLLVYESGIAGNITILSHGGVQIDGSASNISCFEGGYIEIEHGGRASNLFIYSGGEGEVEDEDSFLFNATVYSGGEIDIEEYGVLSNATIHSGAWIEVEEGGKAFNTVLHKGALMGILIEEDTLWTGTSDGSAFAYSSSLTGGVFDSTKQLGIGDGGSANSVTILNGGVIYVDAGGNATNAAIQMGGIMQVELSSETLFTGTSNGSAFSYTSYANGFVADGTKSLHVTEGGRAENTHVKAIPVEVLWDEFGLWVDEEGIVTNTTVEYGGRVNGFTITNTAGNYYTSGIHISGANLEGDAKLFAGQTARDVIIESDGDLEISGGVVSNVTILEDGEIEIYGGKTENTKIHSGGNMVVNYGSAENNTINAGGSMTIGQGSAGNNTINAGGSLEFCGGRMGKTMVNSGGKLVFEGNVTVYDDLFLASGAIVEVATYFNISLDISDRKESDTYLINDLTFLPVSQGTDINVLLGEGAMEEGTYKLAANAGDRNSIYVKIEEEWIYEGESYTSYSYTSLWEGQETTIGENTVTFNNMDGNLTLSVEEKAPESVYGAVVLTSNGVPVTSDSELNSCTLGKGSYDALFVSYGGRASNTTINEGGALHIYSGGRVYETTVNQSGYMGIGQGAKAYDTTIGYAGELTVWGGGVVSRNTMNQWGAIILSSGALAKESIVNSLGGLHVYSGAVASNTTIKEGGILGAGLGATVYETKLDSFGKATLWGGAVANNTSVGYAGELTVLSGGLADTNKIDTWGAVILSSGAIGNSTTILASGGYHIYDGAVAYTTMITSGAFLGIGLGGTVYNLDVQTGAGATFYDGSILRGWNDFAGTVTVGGAEEIAAGYTVNVDAAGSMINLDITERAATDGNIITNAAGFAGATYYVTVDPTKAAGRYYLAGNAAGIDSLTITGTSTELTVGGGGATLDGNTYFALNRDEYNNLFLDVAKISGVSNYTGDLESVDLGTWDEVEMGCDATLAPSDEKKDTGILAIA